MVSGDWSRPSDELVKADKGSKHNRLKALARQLIVALKKTFQRLPAKIFFIASTMLLSLVRRLLKKITPYFLGLGNPVN